MSDRGSGTGDGDTTLLRALFRRLDEIQAELRRQARRMDDMQTVLLDQVRQGQRLERHMSELRDRHLSELRDDLELVIKAELSGRLGMLQTEIGLRFDEVARRIVELEGGDPWRPEPNPLP